MSSPNHPAAARVHLDEFDPVLASPMALFRATARGLAECGVPLESVLGAVLREYGLTPQQIEVTDTAGRPVVRVSPWVQA